MPPSPNPPARQPQVYITEQDLERLQDIVGDRSGQLPGPRMLLEELGRAIVVSADETPQRFVRLNSVVSFEDTQSGAVRQVQLVSPVEADVDQGRISVLTPVGAALIGLTRGAEFAWSDPSGRRHAVKVLDVGEQHDSRAA
jgi:regulator of nucleoside diphosphate kinase